MYVRENRFCSLYCVFFFSSRPHKKWRGCENKSIFPFISQYIIVIYFIFILGYRNSNSVLYEKVPKHFENTKRVPESHLPVLSGKCFYLFCVASTRKYSRVTNCRRYLFEWQFVGFVFVWNVCINIVCVYEVVLVFSYTNTKMFVYRVDIRVQKVTRMHYWTLRNKVSRVKCVYQKRYVFDVSRHDTRCIIRT